MLNSTLFNRGNLLDLFYTLDLFMRIIMSYKIVVRHVLSLSFDVSVCVQDDRLITSIALSLGY